MGYMRSALFVGGLVLTWMVSAETPKEVAQERMAAVHLLIAEVKALGVDTLREEMTVSTAEVFLDYADWDAANITINSNLFSKVAAYKKDPLYWAEFLPDFEREEVIAMLDEAVTNLTRLKNGDITRKPSPVLDWTRISHEGDQLTFNGRPVFTHDYTWKPKDVRLQRFHGNEEGYYIDQGRVNEDGELHGWTRHELTQRLDNPNNKLGFIFLGNKHCPDWAEAKYGPGFQIRDNETYTVYDIDNPGAREMNSMLFSNVAPLTASQQYSELGYMLCNEPHFFTTKEKDSMNPADWGWARGPVSEYSMAAFREWLQTQHTTIDDLNTLWGTSFVDFDAVDLEVPIYEGLQGTPQFYDWVLFNHWRVTRWYTWLKGEIQRWDPAAKVHLKIMPSLWTKNHRGHGIDMEALTEISEIIGNDAGADYTAMWGTHEWQARYGFDWREMSMGFDFYKSVGPDKISYNSEAHYLSTGLSRDLLMKPAYARAIYWLATVHGMNACQTWYWRRRADGSAEIGDGESYCGTVSQQPRIANEVAATYLDMNAHAEELMAMQRQRKPIRIFYSETTAINRDGYMDDVFHLYEKLYFEGVPLGFVTQNILNNQDHANWDVVLVRETEDVRAEELAALQAYLDGGGTVIMDSASLRSDQYGRSIGSLRASAGTLISASSLSDMAAKALGRVASPPVTIRESNGVGQKGCTWKCITNSAGNYVLSIVNAGKTAATLSIALKDSAQEVVAREILTGVEMDLNPVLEPYEVLFMEMIPVHTVEWGIPGGDTDIVAVAQDFAVKHTNYVENTAANPPVGTDYYANAGSRSPRFNAAASENGHTQQVADHGSGDFLRSGNSSSDYDCMYVWENIPVGYSRLSRLEAEVRMAGGNGSSTGTLHWVVQMLNGDWIASEGVALAPDHVDRADFSTISMSDPASLEWFVFSPITGGYGAPGSAVSNDLFTVKSVGVYYDLSGSGEYVYADLRYFKAVLASSGMLSDWELFVNRFGLDGDPEADSDGDGQSDIYEYALGGNPTNAAVGAMKMRLSYEPSHQVSFYHPMRAAEPSGVQYMVEWATNLVTGPWESDWNLEDAAPTEDSEIREAHKRVWGGDKSNLFFRVRFEHNLQEEVANGDLGLLMEAEHFDAQSGIQVVGDWKVGYVEDSDWIRFDAMEIVGATSFTASLASQNAGGTVEVRADSADGILLGRVSVGNTGGWNDMQEVSGSITGATAVSDIYLVFTGGSGFLFDIDYFQFD